MDNILDKPQFLSQHDESCLVGIIRNKWVQSGLAGIPYAGGPIQSYLSNVVAETDKKNWQTFWRQVEVRLAELDETKIDAEYFSSMDFLVRIRNIYAQIIGGADEAKLLYLRNYLIACARDATIDVTWKDLILQYLQEMSGGHILVLQTFYELQSNLSNRDRFELPQRITHSPICVDDLLVTLPTLDRVLTELLAADLSSRGLIGRWLGPQTEPTAWSITDSGLKLMDFLGEKNVI